MIKGVIKKNCIGVKARNQLQINTAVGFPSNFMESDIFSPNGWNTHVMTCRQKYLQYGLQDINFLDELIRKFSNCYVVQRRTPFSQGGLQVFAVSLKVLFSRFILQFLTERYEICLGRPDLLHHKGFPHVHRLRHFESCVFNEVCSLLTCYKCYSGLGW